MVWDTDAPSNMDEVVKYCIGVAYEAGLARGGAEVDAIPGVLIRYDRRVQRRPEL